MTNDQLLTHNRWPVKTVGLWLRDGRLSGVKLSGGAGSEWRVSSEDLQSFIDKGKS